MTTELKKSGTNVVHIRGGPTQWLWDPRKYRNDSKPKHKHWKISKFEKKKHKKHRRSVKHEF